METLDKIGYWTWCQDKYWQYQRRQEWAYEWRGATLVRYHELAMPDPDFTRGLLSWLKLPESVHGFEADGVKYAGCTMYNRPAAFEAEWKPVSAWYEQQEGQIDERTKLKIIRVFQALQRNPKDGEGDGPYIVENGCMYKVSHTYYWNVPKLPEAPQSESGVNYRIGSVARDDETGLWSCYLEKRERVMQEVPEYTSDNTDFAARTEQQFLGVKQGEVPSTGMEAGAKSGVTVRLRVKKNEDCTSDVTIEKVVDKPVEKATVTVERSLRSRTTVVENRNMAQPLDGKDLPAGTRIRNEKTESGLWNTQKTETVPEPPEGAIQESCEKTLFEHSHQKTEVLKDTPEAGDVLDVQVGDGKTTRQTVRRLEDNTFEKDEVVRQENPVENAVVETRKTLRGVRKVMVNRNMPAPASEANLSIGDLVRSEKTPGGRFNQTIETNEKTPIGVVETLVQENAHSRVEQTTENVVKKPSSDVQSVKGHRKSRRIRTTEEDTFDVTETDDKAKPTIDVCTGGTVARKENRTEYRNQETIGQREPGVNEEISAQVRTNEYGLKDGTEIIVTHEKQTKTAKSGSALYEEETTEAINDTETPDATREEGQIVTTSSHPNAHGSASTTKRVRKAKEKESEEVTWKTKDDYYEYTHTVKVYRNQKTVPKPPNGKYRCSVSLSINEFGRYDVIISTTSRTAIAGDVGDAGSSNSGTQTRWIHYQKKDGLLYKRPVYADFTVRVETGGNLHTTMLNGAESGMGFNSHDNGRFGIKYTNIRFGKEEKVEVVS